MSWTYYRAALRGEFGPISEAKPESGFWKAYAGQTENGKKRFVPLGIWQEDGQLVIEHNGIRIDAANRAQVARLWVSAAKSPCTRDDYMHYIEHGRWPADVTDAAIERKAARTRLGRAETLETVAAETVVSETISIGDAAAAVVATLGHNSKAAIDDLAKLRSDIADDVAEMRGFYANNPIRNKTEADIAEDRRKRLADSAREADEARKAEKAPHQALADAVDAKWFPIIREAQSVAKEIDTKNRAWIGAEQDRLRKIAETEARKRFEAERAVRIAAEEKRRQELAAMTVKAGHPPMPDVAEFVPEPMPPAPIVVTPRILVGTTGNRRGTGSATPTAVIVDLSAAAAFLASTQHPDLVALIQKCADRAAKAKATMPGVRMSWEATPMRENV